MAAFFQPNYLDYVLIGMMFGIVCASAVYVFWLHFVVERREESSGETTENSGENPGQSQTPAPFVDGSAQSGE